MIDEVGEMKMTQDPQGSSDKPENILLQLALNAARSGSFEVDLSTNSITPTPEFLKILGLPQTATLTWERLAKIVHVDDRPKSDEALRLVTAKYLPTYQLRLRIYIGRAKTVRWIEVQARGLDSRRLVGIVRDVTDEVSSVEAARVSRSKMNAVLNGIPQLIWTTDLKGNMIYSNDHCRRYSCAPKQNKLQRGWFHSVHPDDIKEVFGRWNAAIVSGDVFEAEYRLKSEDGKFHWFLGRAVPIRDASGAVTEWFGTATNIHDRKLAEKRRHRIQRKVSQLQSIAAALSVANRPIEVAQIVVDQGLEAVDAAAGVVILKAADGGLPILYANGYTHERLEIIKSLESTQDLPVIDSVVKGIPNFISGFEQETKFRDLEDLFLERGHRHALATLPLIVQGNVIGALGISYDQPQEFSKERISYLEILAEQCAQAIERARLFEAEQNARKNAEMASRAKSQFLANMSHEIRTPMNAILGFSDLLGDRTLTSDEREDYRNRIRQNGDQLMRLIDDVLDLSKAEAGTIKVEHVDFSISELVRDVYEATAETARKKGILTRITTDASVPGTIDGDPVRLRQILINLMGNAIKFTDYGRIETRITRLDDNIVIEIEDTGIGISTDLHQRLFKPFSQGDSSVTRRFGGSGLGLVVSRGLAEAMGGTLDLIRSESNRGSIFRLAFPISNRINDPQIDMFRDLEPSPKKASNKKELAGVNVLLVEDSFDNEMLIRAYLKGTGVNLEVARNGEEAVDRASDQNFDVVFMDIQMPVMDGLEATRRLRKRNYDRPIIALSAHALPEEVERSLAAGCHSHLTKPIMRKVLIDQILKLTPHMRPIPSNAVRKGI